MGGSKNKNKVAKAPVLPATPPPPPAGPTPSPMPGQMEAIAAQIGQGYPSMPAAQMLAQLQSIYKPTSGPHPSTLPLIAPAAAAPSALAARSGGMSRRELEAAAEAQKRREYFGPKGTGHK